MRRWLVLGVWGLVLTSELAGCASATQLSVPALRLTSLQGPVVSPECVVVGFESILSDDGPDRDYNLTDSQNRLLNLFAERGARYVYLLDPDFPARSVDGATCEGGW